MSEPRFPAAAWASEIRHRPCGKAHAIEGGDKIPTNPTCWANRTYGPGSNGWTIFGKK